MKKALIYASVASMIEQFNMDNIKTLLSLGYDVNVACNFEFGSTISEIKIDGLKHELSNLGVKYYHVPVPRKITKIKELRSAFFITKKIINEERYDLIHCHSPIGGIICRVSSKHSINYENCKMIYTAHGFHFYKGNNHLKNIVFRNIEKYFAKYTDILITINKEDYNAAKKFKLKKFGKVEFVHGVGLDITKIKSIRVNKQLLIDELKLPKNAIMMLSVGELSKRKNHEVIIKALPNIPEYVHYIVCGQGMLRDELLNLANDREVQDRVHLLGYRSDVKEIIKSCDIFLFPSLQEGLPVALMEALASNLICIASDIRGNKDLINDQINGWIVRDNDTKDWEVKIKYVLQHLNVCNPSLSSSYSCQNVNKEMKRIYS